MGRIDGRAADDLERQKTPAVRVLTAEPFQGYTVARKDKKVGRGKDNGVIVDFVLCVRLLAFVTS